MHMESDEKMTQVDDWVAEQDDYVMMPKRSHQAYEEGAVDRAIV